MTAYHPKSLRAGEFISDAEIRETIAYAEKNKRNLALIDQILEKARPKKTAAGVVCAGLSHREASVLLACDIPEKIEEMYRLAREIKQAFYGNRIVMFAPLYLSNYCVNGCVYCPYHLKNKRIARRKLTQEEIRREVVALQDMATSGWPSNRARIRCITLSSISSSPSRPSIPCTTKTAISAA